MHQRGGLTMREYPDWLIRTSVKMNELLGGRDGFTVCGQLYYLRLLGVTGAKSATQVIDYVAANLFNDDQHCYRAYMIAAIGYSLSGRRT